MLGSAVSCRTPGGLSAWDAWAFWVPKAKVIYFFGELDEQFFRELANPTYPQLVPALEASAFNFMGSVDAVTLHLQFWFLACSFVASVAGLLAARVPGLLLWPFLLLVLVAPRIVGRSLDPQADFLLDYLFALARSPYGALACGAPAVAARLGVTLPRRSDADEAGGSVARRMRHWRGAGRVLAGSPVTRGRASRLQLRVESPSLFRGGSGSRLATSAVSFRRLAF